MKQDVENACGTVAILHCIANLLGPGSLPALPDLADLHERYARQGQSAPGNDEVEEHYVAYVERGGWMWKLDGRRAEGAERCGKLEAGQSLVDAVLAEIPSQYDLESAAGFSAMVVHVE